MEDETGEIDVAPATMLEQIDGWVDGFVRLLPNVAVALAVVLAAWLLGRLAARLARRSAAGRGRENLGEVGGSLLKWGIVIVGVMLAVTIVAPTIRPGDLVAGLGIGSVAIGFAFKDILQNLLAGILILLRQPFEVGDEIVSGGHEGTVERIETRATLIRTYDGRRVVVPNSDIYTDAVVVKTAFDEVRSEYDIQIGCGDDFGTARGIMEDAARGCEGVLSDPPPETIPLSLDADGNTVRLRWWTAPDRASVIHTHGRVVQAAYEALLEAGIDMPYPTRMVLFHDQTEEWDGDRTRQREGWPARGETPRAARISQALEGGRGGSGDGPAAG
ncbi:MAG: mechanosensitive ion channel family protein [Hasllibacter sp.]